MRHRLNNIFYQKRPMRLMIEGIVFSRKLVLEKHTSYRKTTNYDIEYTIKILNLKIVFVIIHQALLGFSYHGLYAIITE